MNKKFYEFTMSTSSYTIAAMGKTFTENLSSLQSFIYVINFLKVNTINIVILLVTNIDVEKKKNTKY